MIDNVHRRSLSTDNDVDGGGDVVVALIKTADERLGAHETSLFSAELRREDKLITTTLRRLDKLDHDALDGLSDCWRHLSNTSDVLAQCTARQRLAADAIS